MDNFSQMFGGGKLPDILSQAMAGARVPYEMEGADQALAAQRTKQALDEENLRMTRDSTNPTKTAENDLATSKALAQNDPDLIKAAVAAQLAESQGKVTEQDDKLRASQRTFIKEMGDELSQKISKNQKPYDPLDATSKGQWDRWVEQAHKLKIPLPPTPDIQPDGSSKVIQDILTKTASMGPGSTDMTNKIAIAQAPAKVTQETSAATNQANERIANSNREGRQDVAEITADSREAVAREKGQRLATYKQIIAADLSANPPRQPNPKILNLAAEDAFIVEADKTALKIRVALAHLDEADKEKPRREKEKWKANWIKDNFGITPGESAGAAPKAAPAQAAPAESKYKPGLVENGYKFKGGDPTKEANWEKVSK